MRKRQSVLLVALVSGFVACAGRSLDADSLYNDLYDGDVSADGNSSVGDGATIDARYTAHDVQIADGSVDVWSGSDAAADASTPDVIVVPDAPVPDVNVPDGPTVIDAAPDVIDSGKPDASDGGVDADAADAGDASDAAKDAKPDATPTESSNATCSDGLDNDGDGFTDCYDFDCWKDTVTICSKAENSNASCSDGIDNDGDGFIDCDDYGCSKNGMVTVCGKDAGKPDSGSSDSGSNDAEPPWWEAWDSGN